MENQGPLQYPDIARSQIHSQAWDQEILELLEIRCKMWLTESTIIPSTSLLHSKIDSSNPTGWKEQKVWNTKTNPTTKPQQKVAVKLIAENVLFFFKLEQDKA